MMEKLLDLMEYVLKKYNPPNDQTYNNNYYPNKIKQYNSYIKQTYKNGKWYIGELPSFLELNVDIEVDESLEIDITTTSPFEITGEVLIDIDWGDGSGIEEYDGGGLTHTYSDSGNYLITFEEKAIDGNDEGKVTGITNNAFKDNQYISEVTFKETGSIQTLGVNAFSNCSRLSEINLSSKINSIGNSCFSNSSLSKIILNWKNDDILSYNNNWGVNNTCKFEIPYGETSTYLNHDYPVGSFTYRGEYDVIYEPVLNADTPVTTQARNSNAYVYNNYVCSFKGAVLKDGWSNTGLWDLSVDVRYQGGDPDSTLPLYYTGLILLTNTTTPFNYSTWGIRNWQGTVTSNPSTGSYTKTPNTTLSDDNTIYPTGVTSWYTLHMRKTSPTTLEVYKEYENGRLSETVTYTWNELSSVDKVTMGSVTNTAQSYTQEAYGSVALRNLKVKKI